MKRILILLALLFLPVIAFSAQWFEGGTLHKANISDWIVATDENKLATIGDFIAGMTEKNVLHQQSMDTLKQASQLVTDCINSYVKIDLFYQDESIKNASILCMRENQKEYPFLLSKKDIDSPKSTQLEDKTLDFTVPEIIINYNLVGKVLKLPTVDLNNHKFISDVYDAYSYELTPFTGIVLICLPSTDKVTSAIFMGAGDGSEISGTYIMLSAITTFASLTPNLSSEQRGYYLDELGITSGTLEKDIPKQVEIGNMLISASLSDVVGLTITISAK